MWVYTYDEILFSHKKILKFRYMLSHERSLKTRLGEIIQA